MVAHWEETKQARKVRVKQCGKEGHGRGVLENSLRAYCCHDGPKAAGGDNVVLLPVSGGVLSGASTQIKSHPRLPGSKYFRIRVKQG